MKTYPYWLDTLSEPIDKWIETTRPPARADVAIVGGGYTGLSAARRLALAGASVVVFERGHVGWGASSRNAGQVLTGLRLDASELVGRYGEARARRLYESAAKATEGLRAVIETEAIACDVEATGHILAAATPRHFASFRTEQQLLARVFDHRVEIVDATDQHVEIGSNSFHGLLVDPGSLGLNPARYVAGLARAAQRSGARIVTHTAVDVIELAGSSAGGWRVVTTGGVLLAREVLVATDAYSDRTAAAVRRRLISVGSFVIVTAPLDPSSAAALLPRRRMAFDSRHFLHYFRLTPDNRLLFDGRAAFSAATPAMTAQAAAILRRDMNAMFPELRDIAVDYAWSGQVAFTRDQMPRAGRIDDLWYAAGYGGHGIAMATYLGDQIARRMAGEKIDEPLFDDGWPPIPLYNGNPWFLPIVGAYYRAKDLLDR